MYTRRGYRCEGCQHQEEVVERIQNPSMGGFLHCEQCGGTMQRYFGGTPPRVNYGRPSRSLTGDDQTIAEFQFQHL